MPKLIVMVERHLQNEFEMLEKLDALNLRLKSTLESSGSLGMSKTQTDELNATAESLARQADELKGRRQTVLSAVNATHGNKQTQITIRQFVQTLDQNTATRLEKLRSAILDRLTRVHSTLVSNQAVMFYSHEFYRKMLFGILNTEVDENQYSRSGQSSNLKPGDLFGKAVE